MVYCTSCGAESLNQDSKCRMCGEELPAHAELELLQSEADQNRRKMRNNDSNVSDQIALPISQQDAREANQAAEVHRSRQLKAAQNLRRLAERR